MAHRVTDRLIKNLVARLQKDGADIGLDGAFGRWRVCNKQSNTNLSPRGSNREILNWLEGYEVGHRAGHVRGFVDGAEDMRKGRISDTALEDVVLLRDGATGD